MIKRNVILSALAGVFLLTAFPALSNDLNPAAADNRSTAQSSQSGTDDDEAVPDLGDVLVEGRTMPSLVTPSISDARERLARVPGGTTLIDAQDFRDSAVRNLADMLTFAPGVFVQSRFGGGETRTSIRGSGISQTYGVRGIRFLRDGLPLNFADGFFNPELIDPLATRFVEVYRGANALQYGAATLGGAVNFISETGYTAPLARVRIGVGSDGYFHPQASFGTVLGDGWDVFASLSGLHQDGFRCHAGENQRHLYANLGYRYNDRMESRLHVNIQHSRLELPGSLTQAQIAADPTQANSHYTAADAYRHIDVRRFAFQHTVRSSPEDKLDVGVFYQNFSLHHPLPFFVLEQHQIGTGMSLRQTLGGTLAGYNNRLIVGGQLARGTNDFQRFAPAGRARKGPLRLAGQQTALTGELFAEDQLQLTQAFTLVAGARFGYDKRQSDIEFGDQPNTDKTYTAISPKIGATWAVTQGVQLYGNLSRSFEPPTFLQLRDPVAGVLDAQTATTLEFGTRGEHGYLKWDLAVYRSWLDNEILTIETPPGSGHFVTNNAGATLHSGLEFGLDARVPLNWLGDDALRLRATYTYNRFRFEADPVFGGNQIPGIPPQFGRFELLYESAGGFYIGPTLAAASAYFVDYANTLETDAYVIVGARAGYDNGYFSVFVEMRNLTNRHYASNTSLVADAHGRDQAVFNPGLGRSVFAGVEMKW